MRRMSLLSQKFRPGGSDARVEGTAAPGEPVDPAAHRLQVGLVGLGAMVLLVGVADMIMTRARLSEQAAVPQAAATIEPAPAASGTNTALEAAGVVPDLPKGADAEPVPEGPVLPEQGRPPSPAGQ